MIYTVTNINSMIFVVSWSDPIPHSGKGSGTQFRFLFCTSSWLKTLHVQFTSHASSLLPTYWKWNLNSLVNHTNFRLHVTEYSAVTVTRSTHFVTNCSMAMPQPPPPTTPQPRQYVLLIIKYSSLTRQSTTYTSTLHSLNSSDKLNVYAWPWLGTDYMYSADL